MEQRADKYFLQLEQQRQEQATESYQSQLPSDIVLGDSYYSTEEEEEMEPTRPPTAKRRPPTAKRRPPTAKRRPPTAKRRPPTAKARPKTSKGRPPTGKARQ